MKVRTTSQLLLQILLHYGCIQRQKHPRPERTLVFRVCHFRSNNSLDRGLLTVYSQNKTLSDSAGLDAVLICQGVGWLLRRAIAIASITAHTYQTEEDGVVTITIHNTSNGGIKGTTEVRHLNGKPTEHTDYIWGHVLGSSRYVATRDLKDDFLKTGWLSETSDGECIENTIEALDGSWTSCMVRLLTPVQSV